jgi:hypothetical protein
MQGCDLMEGSCVQDAEGWLSRDGYLAGLPNHAPDAMAAAMMMTGL